MNEREWLTSKRGDEMLDFAQRIGLDRRLLVRTAAFVIEKEGDPSLLEREDNRQGLRTTFAWSFYAADDDELLDARKALMEATHATWPSLWLSRAISWATVSPSESTRWLAMAARAAKRPGVQVSLMRPDSIVQREIPQAADIIRREIPYETIRKAAKQ